MSIADRLTVALVEDDRLLREEIESHLTAHGFVVFAANSASALDDVLARQAVDLYILDLNLPGENGLSLSRRIRQSLPAAGIVIMTARVALPKRAESLAIMPTSLTDAAVPSVASVAR